MSGLNCATKNIRVEQNQKNKELRSYDCRPYVYAPGIQEIERNFHLKKLFYNASIGRIMNGRINLPTEDLQSSLKKPYGT